MDFEGFYLANTAGVVWNCERGFSLSNCCSAKNRTHETAHETS